MTIRDPIQEVATAARSFIKILVICWLSRYVAEMKSLRDQLLVLKRDRFLSVVVTIFGGIFMLLGVARVMIGGDLITSWFQVVWGFLSLVFGVVMMVRKRRQLRSFELEHGANPATQTQLK